MTVDKYTPKETNLLDMKIFIIREWNRKFDQRNDTEDKKQRSNTKIIIC